MAPETVTPFWVAVTAHRREPSSAEVRRRASTRLLPETVTVPAGLAARVPANTDPSDIATEMAATVVPTAALSGRDAALGVNMTPLGVGGGLAAITSTGVAAEGVTPVFAARAHQSTAPSSA